MKYAVTGSHGFIGTNLCKAIERRGDQVVRVLHDREWPDMLRVDALIHLGAYGTRPGQGDPKGYLKSLELTRQVVAQAEYQDIPCVVAGSVVEEMPIASMYAATKLLSTTAAIDAGATVLRFTTPYGPHESPHRIVPQLIKCGRRGEYPHLSSLNFTRDFVYIDDVVEAILKAVSEKTGVYRVASGTQLPLQYVVAQARLFFDLRSKPTWSGGNGRPWESPVSSVDPMLPGWSAKVRFPDGFVRTAEWAMR